MTRALAALLFLLFAAPAWADVDVSAKVQAQLIAEHDTVTPGGTATIALVEKIKPGWHTYWINPGDAGAPTSIAWELPAGWQAAAIRWPYPRRLPIGPLMDYGYEDLVWLLSDISVPTDAKLGDAFLIKANANWLVCKEICIPEQASITVPVQIGAQPNVPDPDVAKAFAAARTKLPRPSPWPLVFHAGKALDLLIQSADLARAEPQAADFFPLEPGLISNPAEQRFGFAKSGVVIRMTPEAKAKSAASLEGVVILTSADGTTNAFDVHAMPGAVPHVSFVSKMSTLGIWLALLFAFIGGLILNVMPCVLPVLAMKVLSLANQSGAERSAARHEGFAYGAGAIVSFIAFGLLIVVLRAGGEQIGWGFQLQEPIVVAGFALLLFAVGLSLSGVFAFPNIGFGADLTQRGGIVGAFFTGVLAVAVAAPCTAPFMAAALGFALTQSTANALAIFFALGLGFALPFLLIAIWPAALKLLPKPGAWMVRLERILALPMYGAALWLLWVLSQQVTTTGVLIAAGAMIVVAVGAWVWTHTRNLDDLRRGWGSIAALIALLAALWGLWLVRAQGIVGTASSSGDVSGIPFESYTEARLDQARADQRPVFVNATAAWCITCLVNERAVLSQSAMRDAFAAHHVVYLVADWTRRDPAVTELLEKYQRPGVPLYLYFRPGAEAQVLPQVLTEGAILDAIGK